MKVGRNDPCPCGSGKKYKKCHGAGTEAEKIIPFPGCEEGFEAFGDYGPGVEGDGFATGGGRRPGPEGRPPTFMESLGMPNLATGVIHEMEAAAAGRSFASEAEANDFFQSFIEGRNHRGREEFLGLSPEEMRRILGGDFKALAGLLDLGGGLGPRDLAAVPLLESALPLLLALEAGPLKATAAGYLPTSFVEAWWRTIGPRRESESRLLELRGHRKESDDWELLETRRLLEQAGLMERRGPRFELAEEGRRILAEADFDGLFRSLFIALGWEWDWNEFRNELQAHDPLCQEGFVFDLYLLDARAREWISIEELAEGWLRAFPFLAETEEELSGPSLDWIRLSLGGSLVYWPLELGLLEERGGWKEYRRGEPIPRHEVRLSPLFERLIRLKGR